MTNLTLAAATILTLTHSPRDVIHIPGPGWRGWVIPAMGPSRRIDLLNPYDVSEAMGGYIFELGIRPPSEALDYGFNPIPEFKRLRELRLNPQPLLLQKDR
jgi:hypothetical protein